MHDIAEEINRDIFGFSNVISINVVSDEYSGKDYPTYNLRILLENEKKERVELLCEEITELNVQHFHQFPFLRAHDIRAQQLDHVTLKFTEEEFNAIAFTCRSAEVQHLNQTTPCTNATVAIRRDHNDRQK
jgi:hypothetical protein